MATTSPKDFQKVGECLYRNSHGTYFAWFSIHGKQIKRSLKTTDKELARRRLGKLRRSAKGSAGERQAAGLVALDQRQRQQGGDYGGLGGDETRRDWRYCVGDRPSELLKTRKRLMGSPNPQSRAMTAILSLDSRSIFSPFRGVCGSGIAAGSKITVPFWSSTRCFFRVTKECCASSPAGRVSKTRALAICELMGNSLSRRNSRMAKFAAYASSARRARTVRFKTRGPVPRSRSSEMGSWPKRSPANGSRLRRG